ncbi:ankyrin repeat domain-containing protein [uncultured Cocleimonas sp.]|uniref:ankyrin repeat domain-containing protein n=1 Tax=uncultured Cocleimonas sp. TaxID=1051587 RepID=UPI002618B767|nr:ankyrin repeat domain-containing protein [uncultured Cocleimonas sp.]
MRLLFSLFLFLPLTFVSADTSSVNKNSSASELMQFRNNTMDVLDTPYCRTSFKSYLKKKNPKAFLYVPRNKEKTAYCTYVALKISVDDATKMVIKRCEKKSKKSKKNPFTAPCEILTSNHTLQKSRTDFGLKPHAKDLFYIAERYGVEDVKKVLETGVDINQKNELGFTPLLIAVTENNVDIVKYLVSKGADLTLKNNKGFDALIIAANENHVEIAEYLLEKGADITTTDPRNKRQAIHIAARLGYIGILEVLLNKGVDVNQATANKEMPLHLAVQSLYVPTVKYLVKKGADINAIDRSGKTPLDSARKFGTKRMITYLVKQGAKSADSL